MKDVPVDDTDATKRVRIGTTLSVKQESALVDFLQANHDIFAWRPADIPRIPRGVTEHSLNIQPAARPVAQRVRRFD